jgi:hypothetical protein
VNSQQLLIVNFIILSAIVVIFLRGRSKSKQSPTLLRLRDPEPQPGRAEPLTAVQPSKIESNETKPVETKHIETKPDEVKDSNTNPAAEREVGPASSSSGKNLRAIYFVYNGHEWEAHEVMGLPRDSDLYQVTQAYQRLLKTADVSTLEFYEAAYCALLKLKSKP